MAKQTIDGLDNVQISNLPEQYWQAFYKKNKNLIWKKDNFDFDQRVEMLKDLNEFIENTGMVAYFANGLLLGAHREGDFIKWDDDMDFDVLDDEFYNHCTSLKKYFCEKGYIVYLNLEHGKAKLNAYKGLEKLSFDVLFNLNSEQYFRHDMKWPKYLYDNPKKITFKGIDFICPSPIEEYLVHHYGADWQTPKWHPIKKMTYMNGGLFK